MARQRWSSSRRVLGAWLLAATFLLVTGGCRRAGQASTAAGPPSIGSGPIPTASSATASFRSPLAAADCLRMESKTPGDASLELQAAGYRVNWRVVHTSPDGTLFTDLSTQPPSGLIVDIGLDRERGEAFIFAADPSDPAAKDVGPPRC